MFYDRFKQWIKSISWASHWLSNLYRPGAHKSWKLSLGSKSVVVSIPITFIFLWTVSILFVFFLFVDLKPQVTESFFFSSDDPQFRDDRLISEIFPQPPQLVISVKGDIRSEAYTDQIKALSNELEALDEVFSVQSLSHGPDDFEDALESPLWKRVLFSEDGKASFISVFVKEVPSEILVPKIEDVTKKYSDPTFEITISGPPYIMEKIRSYLLRDFKVFSLTAFVIFSVVFLLIFRSFRIFLGTLIACTNSSALTLILARFLGIQIGPLTANLSTIVLVLTLSHIVFLTFNWKRFCKEGDPEHEGNRIPQAVEFTLSPSFWSMATTALGFLSLLFVPATPLRHLGIAGSMGTLVSFVLTYLIYPWFLTLEVPHLPKQEILQAKSRSGGFGSWFQKEHGLLVLTLTLSAVVLSSGLLLIDTDPSLFSYFKKGGELREGLEYIDRNGGSSPLKLLIVDRELEKFTTTEGYKRLWDLHETLEQDPDVGNVVSLPIILAEAKRSPLTLFLTTGWLVDIMESPRFGEIAKYFITEDRKKTLFLLRMKETSRQEPRLRVVERIKNAVQNKGFAPALVGGVYLLQGTLAALLHESLISGLGLLIVTFTILGWRLSRSVPIALAMLISLAVMPAMMLGVIGHLGIPLDVISAPAPNLAIGMGVDSMIHVLNFVKRFRREKHGDGGQAWIKARLSMWRPVLSSATLVSTGFGIFILSTFPPTQRFGFSVVLGTVIVPFVALLVLPWTAARFVKIKEEMNDVFLEGKHGEDLQRDIQDF
ncbi:MAG: MMPL family transporter [Candidatus Omnitrophica bacterium]|nr:MMPL family transporter [Candidatus Omnitrophota bacterium]